MPSRLALLVLALVPQLFTAGTAEAEETAAASVQRMGELTVQQAQIVTRARLEVMRAVKYAATWQRTSGYPMGDIPTDRGACTDLVVRSLRAAGIDLQRMVHEDMIAVRGAYGVERPDPTIDHRRASTLLVFFRRKATALSTDTRDARAFAPGDVVFYHRPRANNASQLHVAVVSDKIGPRGLPMILENGGPRPVESDALDRHPMVGHFRAHFHDGAPEDRDHR